MMDDIGSDDSQALAEQATRRFWREVQDQCSTDGGEEHPSSDSLGERLDAFYTLCESGFDTHLQQKNDVDAVLAHLFQASFFVRSPLDVCATTLTALAVAAVSLPRLTLLYETLLKLSERNANIFQSCASATQLLPRLVHHFWAARYAQEYNQRHDLASDSKRPAPESLEWNIKHVRSSSKAHVVRQRAEQRDRALQIRLCDRSISMLYEICRSRRLNAADLRSVDAAFVDHLFDLVEQSRSWTDDSYSDRLIKLIVALNEQFMVSGISSASNKPRSRKSTASASNTVLTVLRTRLNASKTFGENVIFMLNRASSRDAEDVCMQLLILKLLYLLFTTKETSHYFYTNDLKVLVDVFIRELSDLPDEHESLRHTYLRVLHPLLTNTQLLTYPYKRAQVRNLLVSLTSLGHLRDISPTTLRLVERCLSAQWCVDLDQSATGGARVGEELSHSLAVQSIRGGPSTIVQASVVVDGEGIAIPVGPDRQPVQGSSTAESTAAVLAPVQVHSDGTTNGSMRARTQRIKSFEGLSSEVRSSLGATAVSLVTGEAEHQVSSPTSLQGSDVSEGAPASFARPRWQDRLGSPPYLLQPEHTKRVHSAIDVRRFASVDDADSENDSECHVDSASQSWHQSMSRDQLSPAERRRAGTGSSLRTPTSEMARSEGLEQRRGSEGSMALPSMNAPTLMVHNATDDGVTSTHRNGSGILRRPPPAPPTARERQDVRESSEATEMADDYLSGEGGSSRATSPLPPGSLPPPSTLSSLSGRRRRPPPPPVDRSTKAWATEKRPATDSTIEDPSAANPDAYATRWAGERHEEGNHLTKYMEHLQLTSERGYGW